MRKIALWSALMWSGLGLTGCAGGVSDLPVLQASGTGDLPSYTYRLAGGDSVRVIVYDAPDLGGEFTINGAGDLALPLIGDISAIGLTTAGLQDVIRARLADGFVKDPRVNVEVLTLRPFYILGEVKNPGEYPFVNGLTVMGAVARGGGFSYRANTGRVMIQHAGEAEAQAYQLDPATPVAPGDIITIKERWF